jgi:hypothetical protein
MNESYLRDSVWAKLYMAGKTKRVSRIDESEIFFNFKVNRDPKFGELSHLPFSSM